MEFGIFHEFQCRDGLTEAQVFDESFALVDAAEEWGLDAVWLAELHMDPKRSVISAPLTVAAAIAARTRRMDIGIAVQVLPLCHPLRLAEEVATVDHIARGRLIFGVGRSGFFKTYEAYGVPYAESRERFAEVLDIVERAWTEHRFSYEGRFHRFEDVCVVPKPYTRPHPPIRIAATSPDTFPVIGRLGYPIFCAVRAGALSELGPAIRAYRAAWKEAGHPGEGTAFLRVPVHLDASAAAARAAPEAGLMAFYRQYADRLGASEGAAGVDAAEGRAERGARLGALTYDDVLRDKVLVGTPDMVTERLRALRDELGLDGILAELNCGATLAAPVVTESLRLLCREVMPHFRPKMRPPATAHV